MSLFLEDVFDDDCPCLASRHGYSHTEDEHTDCTFGVHNTDPCGHCHTCLSGQIQRREEAA